MSNRPVPAAAPETAPIDPAAPQEPADMRSPSAPAAPWDAWNWQPTEPPAVPVQGPGPASAAPASPAAVPPGSGTPAPSADAEPAAGAVSSPGAGAPAPSAGPAPGTDAASPTPDRRPHPDPGAAGTDHARPDGDRRDDADGAAGAGAPIAWLGATSSRTSAAGTHPDRRAGTNSGVDTGTNTGGDTGTSGDEHAPRPDGEQIRRGSSAYQPPAGPGSSGLGTAPQAGPGTPRPAGLGSAPPAGPGIAPTAGLGAAPTAGQGTAPVASGGAWGQTGSEGIDPPISGTAPLPVGWGAGAAPGTAAPGTTQGLPSPWSGPGAGTYQPVAAPNAGPPHAGQAHAGPPAGGPGYASYAPGKGNGPSWAAVLGIAAATGVLAALAGAGIGIGLADRDLPGVGTSVSGNGYAALAASVLPSVVTIRATSGSSGATGSGFVYDDDGHVITNNHVVEGVGDNITIVLADGRKLTATVVGTDPAYDVAVLATDRSDLDALPMGDSDEVKVGEEVLAVGAPLGLTSTVTAGIVSAVDRPVVAGDSSSRSYINAIQTDAAINPGNSGGPLIDRAGRVIGVNSAIATPPGSDRTGAGNIGLGFAIPSEQVVKTADQLIKTGSAEHPVIGVLLDPDYTGPGARVQDESSDTEAVTSGGPADKAGIRPGDVIVSFDGNEVTDSDDLIVAIRARSVGDSVTVTVRRDGRDLDVTMTLQAAKK